MTLFFTSTLLKRKYGVEIWKKENVNVKWVFYLLFSLREKCEGRETLTGTYATPLHADSEWLSSGNETDNHKNELVSNSKSKQQWRQYKCHDWRISVST